jgi:CHAD domain-containing protein
VLVEPPAFPVRPDCAAPSCKRRAPAADAWLGQALGVAPEISLAPLTRRTPSAEVARRALAACVARLVRALARVLVDDDEEWIHQARCAARALRANLKAFGPLFDPQESAQLDARLSALGESLGRVRDNDVLIEHITVLAKRLPEVGSITVNALLSRCHAVREIVYAALISELRDDAYPRLVEDLVRAVCRDSPLIVRPDGLRRKTLMHDVIGKPWRQLKRAVRDCDDDPTAAQLHALRIKVKRCRYATEAVVSLVTKPQAPAARQFLRRLARLQDTLGSFHDAVIESDRLRELAASKLDRFVAGEVAGLEAKIADAARGSWRKAWKRASQRKLRFWRAA